MEQKYIQDCLSAPKAIDEEMRKSMEAKRVLMLRDVKYKLLSGLLNAIESQGMQWSNHEDRAVTGIVSDVRNLVFEWMCELQKEEYGNTENVTISNDEYARLKEVDFMYKGLCK